MDLTRLFYYHYYASGYFMTEMIYHCFHLPPVDRRKKISSANNVAPPMRITTRITAIQITSFQLYNVKEIVCITLFDFVS